MTRWVEVGPGPLSCFGEGLEAMARAFTRRGPDGPEDYARSVVEEELALALERIGRLRDVHRDAKARMTELECEVGTDLMGMETPRWWYSRYRMELWRDRQGLKARRARLAFERNRLEADYEKGLTQARAELLDLLQRHKALRG